MKSPVLMRLLATFPILCLVLSPMACHSPMSKPLEAKKAEFQIENLAKADVDMFADVIMNQSLEYLRSLTNKLYLRNPNQLKRGNYQTIEQAIESIFTAPWPQNPAGLELSGKRSVQAIQTAFDESFSGDRVAVLISGLRDMLLDAYAGQTEFYLTTHYEPQKIYNLARNFEVAFWKLNHDTNHMGQPYLLSNATGSGETTNLSFERLYGKLIALHDQMAVVIANSTNRRLKNILQGAATMVFRPI